MKRHFDIFISYRRKGGSEKAELLRLMFEKNGFRSKKIFMDTHTLGANDVKPHLQEAIEASDNVIVLITEGCFDEIKNDDLWIFEIKEAIKLQKNIIPAFFDGIKSFDGLNVPTEISSLKSKQGACYYHDYADAFYEKLCSLIVKPKKSKKHILSTVIMSVLALCVLLFGYQIHGFLHGNDNNGRMDTIKENNRAEIPLNGSDNKNTDTIPKQGINNDKWNKYSAPTSKKYYIIDVAVAKEMGVETFYRINTGNRIDISNDDWFIPEAKKILHEEKQKKHEEKEQVYNIYKNDLINEIQTAYDQYVAGKEITTFQFREESYIKLSEIKTINIQL